jgi:hypothetical protein
MLLTLSLKHGLSRIVKFSLNKSSVKVLPIRGAKTICVISTSEQATYRVIDSLYNVVTKCSGITTTCTYLNIINGIDVNLRGINVNYDMLNE